MHDPLGKIVAGLLLAAMVYGWVTVPLWVKQEWRGAKAKGKRLSLLMAAGVVLGLSFGYAWVAWTALKGS